MSAKCPVCGKPADPAHKPFCGRGCKDRDLLRWLNGGYRIPGHDAPNGGVDNGLDMDGDPD